MAEPSLALACFTVNDDGHIFLVEISRRDYVFELAKRVCLEGPATIASIRPAQIILWMLVPPLSSNRRPDFLERVRAMNLDQNLRQEPNSPAILLDPAKRVGEYFPSEPLKGHVYVLVQVSGDAIPPFSCTHPTLSTVSAAGGISGGDEEVAPHRRMSDLQKWKEFWDILWGKGDVFIEPRLSNHGEFETMPIYSAFPLRLKGILIREEWKEAWKHAQVQQQQWIASFIIIGYPGIGKTLSLYYFLAKRVSLGLPTFFQIENNSVWFFHEAGVTYIHPEMYWKNVKEANFVDKPVWALVNSDSSINSPAPVLCAAPIFIVQAACQSNNWRWTKCHWPSVEYYAKPFSLQEMLQGNMVQAQQIGEESLRDFYTEYGPSARDCYFACRSEAGLQTLDEYVKQSIQMMSWDVLLYFIAMKVLAPTHLSHDCPQFVVVVEPTPATPFRSKVNVVTRPIMRRLWKAQRHLVRQHAEELYCIFLDHPRSITTAGWLFEALVHDALEHGIDKPLHRLKGNDLLTFTNATAEERWNSQCMEYVAFSGADQFLLKENSYYVPVDSGRSCFHYSFTFEFTSNYCGPVLDTDGTILSEEPTDDYLPLFSIFAITLYEAVDVKEDGLDHILKIAAHNGFKALAIRYIAVMPFIHGIEIKSPITWRGNMSIFALTLSPDDFRCVGI